MNRKALVISLVIILVALGGGLYLFGNRVTLEPPRSASTNQPVAVADSPNLPESSAGVYTEYHSDIIAGTAGTKVLFFYAPWCPQCRALEADIKQNGVPAGVTIIKTDYDNNQALRQRYGVTLQTTFVKVDDQGNLVKKYVAYDDPTLDAVKANLL